MSFHTHGVWPIVAALTLPLAACQPMDAIEGKPSAFQAHVENMALLTMPEPLTAAEPAVTVTVDPTKIADAVLPAPVPAPQPVVAVPPPAPCHEVWRVTRCVDGVAEEWVGF